jgi:lysophospholipase L1-like esterase
MVKRLPASVLQILKLFSIGLLTCLSMSMSYADTPKVVYIGNSITNHGPSANIGWNGNWGMAASSADKDYVHLVSKGLNTTNYKLGDGIHLEKEFANLDLSKYNNNRDFQPDIIVVRVGENATGVNTSTRNAFKESVKKVVNHIRGNRSDVKVIVATTFWRESQYVQQNTALREASIELGAKTVELSDLHDKPGMTAAGLFQDTGVASHPSDAGMSAIAQRILVALANPTTPPDTTVPEPPVQVGKDTDKRWIALAFLNVDVGVGRPEVLRQAVADGVNAIHVNVNWEKVYKTRNSIPDWSLADSQVAIAKELGVKVILRIWVGRHEPGDQSSLWWTRQQKPIDPEGKYANGVQCFSYFDKPSVEDAANFVREVAEHYKVHQQEKRILYTTVVNSQASETHFNLEGRDNNGRPYMTTFDYSDVAIAAFRQWLQVKYKTIGALNKAWNSDYSGFDKAKPLSYPGTSYTYNFPWQIGQDWYLFRHDGLKKFIDKMVVTIKSVDNTYQFVPDFGSVFDPSSILRGTYAFKTLAQNCDGVKNNDAPSHPHAFIADLLRSNLKPGQWIGTEVDGSVSSATQSDYNNHIDEWFSHGGNLVNIFGFDRPEVYGRIKNSIIRAKSKWLDDPYVQPIDPMETMSYSVLSALQRVGTYDVQQEWKAKATSAKNPVRIILDESIIQTIPVDNIAPVVQKAIPDQATRLGEDFTYEIDQATFADEDGYIAFVSAEGLPEGLSLTNWKVSGRTLYPGQYRVKIKANDNAGGTVETSFTLTVANSNRKNVVSLYTSGNFLTRRFLQNLVGGDTLTRDEIKSAVNILVYPISGTVGSYSFNLTGPVIITTFDNESPYALFGDNGGQILPPGQYTLEIKSYTAPNLAGSLIAEETVRFIIPNVISKNQAPVLFRQPAPLFAQVGEAFSYQLSDSTFVDYDGEVIAYSFSGLPDGLTATGTEVSGTPTQNGEFSVEVVATDNSGDFATTSFLFTVSGTNEPPVVAKVISEQATEKDQPYRFTIPAETFQDPDGTIARIEVGGLPAGLSFAEGKISGSPSVAGDFEITVTAFDNNDLSVSTKFKLTIALPNKPPVLTEVIPDVTAFIGQTFKIDVKGFFSDPDGTVVSVSYVSEVPPGMKAEGTVLSGEPKEAGVYPVRVKATDNKGASVETEFKLVVESSKLTVDLVTAQGVKIQELKSGSIIPTLKLPASVNIFVSGNSNITSVAFEMSGTLSRTFTDETAPFGLFDNVGGFSPKIGTYILKVQAYRNGTLVLNQTIRFDFIRAGNSNVREGVIEEEEVLPEAEVLLPQDIEPVLERSDLFISFPNPFEDRVKVNTNFIHSKDVEWIELHAMTGQSVRLLNGEWNLSGSVLDIDLTRAAKVPGLYVMTIVDSTGKRKSIKVVKAGK